MTDKVRGIAEVEAIHRDKNGVIISVEKTKIPVTYRVDNDGQPFDFKEVK